MRTSTSATLHILTILFAFSSMMMFFASADDECRKDITGGKSWDEWLEDLSYDSSKKDICDDKDGCQCEQTMRAENSNSDTWNYARKLNEKYLEEREDKDLDIVMVGDSITEKFHGTKVRW